MLSAILLCEARTFLTESPPARLPGPLLSYYIGGGRKCQRRLLKRLFLNQIFKEEFRKKG